MYDAGNARADGLDWGKGMPEPAAEIEKAVFAALEPLVGRMSFDHPSRDGSKPQISLGRTGIRDWSTGGETGEQLLTVHIWSKTGGSAQAAGLTGIVRTRLLEGLDLGEGRLVRMRLDFEETRHEADFSLDHGLLRFRACIKESGG
jgi:hypothetical protein